jgi:hypothetical protein
MSQFYSADLEAFYSIDHIYPTEKRKNGKIVEYCYSGSVNIIYRNNPTDPETNLLSKDTTCSHSECYPVPQYDKAKSERAFEQALIRHCMKGASSISDDDANDLKNQWGQSSK